MKKLLKLALCFGLIFIVTGCFKRDNMEDISIYTTAYPLNYITNRLYGTRSNVKSIYPIGVNINDYTLTEKQINNYSKAGLFIFNGIGDEKNYVSPMVDKNKNLKIINATLTMEYTNRMEELWLDPSNFLKISQNIKTGLEEYISNHYLKNEINEKYEQLKIDVSNLDAKFNLLSESASNKTIVVSSDLWLFLSKYKFNVISLEENANLTDRKIQEVKNLIKNNQVHYIFINENEEISNTINNIKTEHNIDTITLHNLANLTEEEASKNEDYFSIMNENMELLKQELYN